MRSEEWDANAVWLDGTYVNFEKVAAGCGGLGICGVGRFIRSFSGVLEFNMVRLCLIVIAVYGICCGLAMGQTQPPAMSAGNTGSNTRERPDFTHHAPAGTANTEPEPMERGGSMMRAGMAAAHGPHDPAHSSLNKVSVFSVPPPEPKLIKKFDLVTIIVREESEVSSQGTSDLKRESTVDASINQFVKLNFANMALAPAVGPVAPSVNLTGNRNFKGEATVDRTDSVIMRVTARVLDVKPNGTLVLEARKKIKNDEEEQTLVCSGTCRVEDLTPDNTVLSTQLYDLDFAKTNKGQVRATTKTGLVHKLLDFINPF
jgi:flagellar L-ring protein precursor FlgH